MLVAVPLLLAGCGASGTAPPPPGGSVAGPWEPFTHLHGLVDLSGRRLLVTGAAGNTTRVFALDCQGRVHALTRSAPLVEGGIVVAPPSFGRYGGQLIAPDEKSGRVVAIDQRGDARTIARSGLPTG